MSTVTSPSLLYQSAIVVGVPGPWASPDELAVEVFKVDSRYLIEEDRLYLPDGDVIHLEWQPTETGLEEAFSLLGGGLFSDEELARVRESKHYVRFLSPKRTITAAGKLLDAVAVVLSAGGAGVKVDSAGVAHTPARWRLMQEQKNEDGLQGAFVVQVADGSGQTYTAGLRNFSLPDIILEEVAESTLASLVLTLLCRYQLAKPGILEREGRLFFPDPILERFANPFPEYRYPREHYYYNPEGIVQILPPVSDDRQESLREARETAARFRELAKDESDPIKAGEALVWALPHSSLSYAIARNVLTSHNAELARGLLVSLESFESLIPPLIPSIVSHFKHASMISALAACSVLSKVPDEARPHIEEALATEKDPLALQFLQMAKLGE